MFSPIEEQAFHTGTRVRIIVQTRLRVHPVSIRSCIHMGHWGTVRLLTSTKWAWDSERLGATGSMEFVLQIILTLH